MKDQRLELSFTKEEYEQIVKNAKHCGMKVSAYIRKYAVEPNILNIEYKSVNEHSEYLFERNKAISQLVSTIIKRKEYVPKDLEYILEVSEDMLKSQKEFIENFKLEQKQNEKIIKKTIKEIIKKEKLKGNSNEKKS